MAWLARVRARPTTMALRSAVALYLASSARAAGSWAMARMRAASSTPARTTSASSSWTPIPASAPAGRPRADPAGVAITEADAGKCALVARKRPGLGVVRRFLVRRDEHVVTGIFHVQ